jgi:hypothetical protein
METRSDKENAAHTATAATAVATEEDPRVEEAPREEPSGGPVLHEDAHDVFLGRWSAP